MKQKGFIFPSLHIALISGAIVLVLGVALKVQSSRLESCKVEHKAFVSEVERLGKEAQEKVKLTEALNLRKKEQADESLRKLRSVNDDLSKRVRDSAGGSFVSSGETVTGKPDLACFSRAELDAALQRFTGRTAELIVEGTENTLNLDNAKQWALK